MALCGVEIKSFPALGRAAVSTRAFTRGQPVLIEEPLLTFSVGPGHPQAAELAACAAATGAPEVLFSAMLAYAAAPPATRKRALGMFGGPEALGAPGSGIKLSLDAWLSAGPVNRAWVPLAERLAAAAEHALQALEALRRAKLPVADLARLAAVVILNQHSYGPAKAALFEMGAILAHSCAPNATPMMDLVRWDGRAVFVALADIAPGQLVNACYLARSWNLTDRATRRHILIETKLFECACERCAAGGDYCGLIPCPACCGVLRDPVTGYLPLAAAAAIPPERHLLLDAGAAGGAGPHYTCQSCGARVAEEEQALFGGPEAVAALRRALAVPPEVASVQVFLRDRLLALDAEVAATAAAAGAGGPAHLAAPALRRVCADAARALGPLHGLTKKAQILIAELALSRLAAASVRLRPLLGAAAPLAGSPDALKAAAAAAEAAKEMWAHADEYWAWIGVVSDAGRRFCGYEEAVSELRGFGEALLILAEGPAGLLPEDLRRVAAERAAAFLEQVDGFWRSELPADAPALAAVAALAARAAVAIAALGPAPAAAGGAALGGAADAAAVSEASSRRFKDATAELAAKIQGLKLASAPAGAPPRPASAKARSKK